MFDIWQEKRKLTLERVERFKREIEYSASKRTFTYDGGYVYLISPAKGKNEEWIKENLPIVKIGQTVNNPAQRLQSIQSSLWIDLEITHVCRTNVRNRLERLLHSLFETYRKNGEWFFIDNQSVVELSQIEGLVEWRKYNALDDYDTWPRIWSESKQREKRFWDEWIKNRPEVDPSDDDIMEAVNVKTA